MKKLSRRHFLKLTGLAIAGAAATTIPITTEPESPSKPFEKTGREIVNNMAMGLRTWEKDWVYISIAAKPSGWWNNCALNNDWIELPVGLWRDKISRATLKLGG